MSRRRGASLLAIEELALSATTGVTLCDASDLWLALTLGAELVTLDQQLAKWIRVYKRKDVDAQPAPDMTM